MLAIGKDDEPVTVDADSLTYDREADALHAKGDVMVTTGDSVLAADQIDIDRKTGQANAAGQVVLEDPQGRLRAENATFFLEDETGCLEEGEVYMPQTRFQITGKRIEKGIGQSYHIWDGTLTTCQCEDGAPDWSITGEEIDLSLGGFGTLHDGTFKIKDTPVLYLPYGIFPVQRERQSGFLFPRFGYSNSPRLPVPAAVLLGDRQEQRRDHLDRRRDRGVASACSPSTATCSRPTPAAI